MNAITRLFFIICLSFFFSLSAKELQFNKNAYPTSGSFNFFIQDQSLKEVPIEIPSDANNIKITLKADKNIDLQLYNADSGKAIVGWNIGALMGETSIYSSIQYNGVTIEYSGYNGDCSQFFGSYTACSKGASPGNEYITIKGMTKNRFKIKLYGQDHSNASLYYSWDNYSPSQTRQSDQFSSYLNKKTRTFLGTIPAGTENPVIFLNGNSDLDIELYDSITDELVVGWKSRYIDSAKQITEKYKKDKITWSGWGGRYYTGSKITQKKRVYNSPLIDAYVFNDTKSGIIKEKELGREFIRIHGVSKNAYKMYVFAYQSGKANIEYSWGVNPIYAGLIGMGQKYLSSTSNKDPSMYPAVNGVMPEFVTRYNDSSHSAYGHTLKQANLAAAGVNIKYMNGGLHNSWRDFKGVAGIGIKLSNYLRGAGNINIFSSGNVRYTYNKIKSQINNNAKNQIFVAGHSSGGGDAQDILWRLKSIGQPVEASFQIDSAEFSFSNWGDAKIPSNTKHAFNYWENEVWYVIFGPRESFIYAQNPQKTSIQNTHIVHPSCNTDGKGNCKEGPHGAIDNDPRVFYDILDKIQKYMGLPFHFFE
jgi:hypothetical protein